MEEDNGFIESSATVAPILLSSGAWISIAALLAGDPFTQSVLASIAVALAFPGGVMEIYTILYLRRLVDLARYGRSRNYLNLALAGVYVGLYYVLVGVYLIGRELRSLLEYATGKILEETPCSRAYSPLLFILTLGLYLSPFQACVFKSVLEAAPITGAPEGLSLEGDKGEQDPGGPDGLIHYNPPC